MCGHRVESSPIIALEAIYTYERLACELSIWSDHMLVCVCVWCVYIHVHE